MTTYYRGYLGDLYANYGTPDLNNALASQGHNAPSSGPSFAQVYAAQSQENQANSDHQIQVIKLQQQGDLDKMKMQAQLGAGARSDAEDFAARQQAASEQFQGQQADKQRFTGMLEEGGRQYEQEQARLQQHGQFEETRGDQYNLQADRENFAADQTDAEGQIQSGLLAQRQGYDASRDVYNHGAAMDMANQKAQLDVWVRQRDMTNAETMDYERTNNMVSKVWNDPNLSDQEKMDLVTQMRTKIDIGKQRLENTRANQMNQMTQIQMAQEAQKFRIGQMNSQQLAQEMESHSYTDPHGNTFVADPLGNKIIHIPAKAAGAEKGGPNGQPFDVKSAYAQAHALEMAKGNDPNETTTDPNTRVKSYTAAARQSQANITAEVRGRLYQHNLTATSPEYRFDLEPQSVQNAFAAKYGPDGAAAGWLNEHTARMTPLRAAAMGQQHGQRGNPPPQSLPNATLPEQDVQSGPQALDANQIGNAMRAASGLPPAQRNALLQSLMQRGYNDESPAGVPQTAEPPLANPRSQQAAPPPLGGQPPSPPQQSPAGSAAPSAMRAPQEMPILDRFPTIGKQLDGVIQDRAKAPSTDDGAFAELNTASYVKQVLGQYSRLDQVPLDQRQYFLERLESLSDSVPDIKPLLPAIRSLKNGR